MVLTYNTAWAPNNLTLLKLSKVSGRWIQNEYEEPGFQFEGVFICEKGAIILDLTGPYRPECGTCLNKYKEEELAQDVGT